MSIIFKRERNTSLVNLKQWNSKAGPLSSSKPLSVELSIMYCDESSLKQRNERLHDLYLTGFYTDVILKVNNDTLSVHGIVLSSASEYFQVMLQSSFRESSTKTIDFSTSFEDIAVLKLVVDYMYTGKVMLRRQTLDQVLGAAHLFMIHTLKHHCAQFLLEQLQPQNVIWTWKLAYLYDMKQLEIVCSSLLPIIFCRQIIDETDFSDFTSNCITSMIDNEELITNAKPDDISYFIISWMNDGDFDTRKDIAKAILLKYLNNQALDVILESVNGLTETYNNPSEQFSSYIPGFSGKVSWRRSGEPSLVDQVTLPIDRDDQCPVYYGILAREMYCHGTTIFCEEKNKWVFDSFNIGDTPLGIIHGNYLVTLGKDLFNVCLTNLSTKVPKAMPSILRTIMREGRTVNPSKETTVYFCLSGELYVILNCWDRTSPDLVFSLYTYDIVNSWVLLLDIKQNLVESGITGTIPKEDLTIRLRAIPVEGNIVFVVAQILSKTGGKYSSENGEENKEKSFTLPVSYMYRISPMSVEYELLSHTFMNLGDIQSRHVILLNGRLQFMDDFAYMNDTSDSDEDGEDKWISFNMSYDLETNDWLMGGSVIPIPEIPLLPLQNQKNFPRNTIKVCGHIIWAFIHLSPHICHVYMYDTCTHEWEKLPNILSPSVAEMTFYTISATRPLCCFFMGENTQKQIETSGFHFMNSSLKSWKGIRGN
ncbi:kelch-like protein 2 [Argonauta hians]